MSYSDIAFTKKNVDIYLKELGKEYKRINGRGTPAEIILIGGASILVNYGFRDMTNDIDVLMHAASTMKEAILNVADKYGLPDDWLNSDFKKTTSFTFKLFEYSKYYKTFYGVLTVRVISGEYLIAMKMVSGREYKKDMSDIIGILAEHETLGKPISMEQIKTASVNLYGDWEKVTERVRTFVEEAFEKGNFRDQYNQIRAEEEKTLESLIEFEAQNPGVVKRSNINDVVRKLKENAAKKDTNDNPDK